MDKQHERERFELFLKRVEKIRRNSLIAGDKLRRVRHIVHSEDGKGVWSELQDATGESLNIESFDSLIVALRLVYMDTEPIAIPKIVKGLCEFAPADQKATIENFKKAWNAALKEDSPLADEHNRHHPVHEILDSWLYGEVTHSDNSKREFIEKWGELAEAQTVFIVNFLIPYVLGLGQYVQKALDEGWV